MHMKKIAFIAVLVSMSGISYGAGMGEKEGDVTFYLRMADPEDSTVGMVGSGRRGKRLRLEKNNKPTKITAPLSDDFQFHVGSYGEELVVKPGIALLQKMNNKTYNVFEKKDANGNNTYSIPALEQEKSGSPMAPGGPISTAESEQKVSMYECDKLKEALAKAEDEIKNLKEINQELTSSFGNLLADNKKLLDALRSK